MPLYEYECPRCGRFDVLQKMSDEPLQTHEVCGSKVRKLVSASAFAFKGSGFYATDYGKGSACARAAGEKGERKSEGKPDACATCPANQAA